MDVVWDIRGKVVLVTGASSGIGLETAAGLAERGAEVLLLCRNPDRGRAAQSQIRQRSGLEPRLFLADLGSQSEIRRVALEILDATPVLHVLINNAGAYNDRKVLTVDGIETTFAVNHLAYFLLTSLLLERLKASAPARIINVASDAHRYGWIDFSNLQGERLYFGWFQYAASKLANLLFTQALIRRLQGTGVTAHAVHPGLIGSGFAGNANDLIHLFFKLAGPLMKSSATGALTSLHVATAPAAGEASELYWKDSRPRRASRRARDVELAERLWAESEALTGEKGTPHP